MLSRRDVTVLAAGISKLFRLRVGFEESGGLRLGTRPWTRCHGLQSHDQSCSDSLTLVGRAIRVSGTVCAFMMPALA